MRSSRLAPHVEAARRFNRFYTKRIGVLEEGRLHSPFSLTEARVIYELAHHEQTTAQALGTELGLDAGYLSRVLRSLESRKLIRARRSEADGRQKILTLTERGLAAFADLNAASHAAIESMIGTLSNKAQAELTGAMATIERLLAATAERKVPYILRPHAPGDMGWVVERHGALYAEEYGWDETFEALVAEIIARFIRRYNPKRDRCWIVEREGENVGCVFCVQRTRTVAQLRLLLVEPSARGMGIGRRLVEECVAFARRTGYRTMVLWTNDVLHAARRIYETVGFRLIEEERHHSFGKDLVGQTWALKLTPRSTAARSPSST